MNHTVKKIFLRLSIIILLLILYFLVPTLKTEIDGAAMLLARADIKGMKQYLLSFGILGPLVSMLLMVFQALAAPLPAFVITFANAWIWGWAWGTLISWSGAMFGAVICFYLAKWFGRPLVEKMVGMKPLQMTDRFFEKYGRYAVLIARLMPFISFDLISYAAGLTNISLWEFFWATGLGQLPATIVYSLLGQNITSGAKYGLWVFAGFASLLVISFIIKKRMDEKLMNEGD